MNKTLKFALIVITEAIVIGFIVKNTNYETGILTLLVLIYSELRARGE